MKDTLRLFGMKSLLAEAELARLEKEGIEIHHQETIKQDEIVDVDLFEPDIRAQAKKMSELYFLQYCLENSIRRFIAERLTEKHGASWWDTQVPTDVQQEVDKLRKQEKDTPMEIRSADPLAYTNFGDLVKIIDHNWSDFSDTIRSQKAMGETLNRLSRLRNPIAHSCEMDEDDITRFMLHMKDWQRIQM